MENQGPSQRVSRYEEGPSQVVNEEVENEGMFGTSITPEVSEYEEAPSQVVNEEVVNEAIFGTSIIPEVDTNLKPQIGMVFKSLEDAEVFYKAYGKAGGFDTRSSSTKYSKERELIDKTYVCAKEGETKSKSNDIRKFGSMRTNCKAMLCLKLDMEQRVWIVRKFVEEHNHEVATPRRRHLLRGNRTVCNAKRKLVKQFREVNIPTNKAIALLEHESGGYDRIGCTEKDIRNYERDLRVAVKGHDAQMLKDYFEWAQEKNPSFYYIIKTDNDKKLTHCFWVDAIARLNYKQFSDVLIFDTTHQTNQYGLVFAPFIGVNHHRQSIFLGCAFIPNESADSFIWIFERFLEVMEYPPAAIVTDQDLGMRVALSRVFPHTRHRLCMWHILEKVKDKLGSWAYNEKFMASFKHIVWESENAKEFETSWNKLMTETGLITNDWLTSLWEMRQQWIPAYQKKYFWAGISSSQRSEGMNALLKMNVSRSNTLLDFVTIFDRALAKQREQELLEDHNSLEKKPKLKTGWAMEEHMSKVYTRSIFYIFQEELCSSLLYNVVIISENAAVIQYKVLLCGEEKVSKVVEYSKSTQLSTCSCMMFEFRGIPCRHILAYLKYSNHTNLPEKYILKRWTRDVKRGIVADRNGNIIGDGSRKNYSSRFIELTRLAHTLVDEGLSSDAAYNFALSCLEDNINKIRSLKIKDVGESQERNDKEIRRRSISDIEVHEPDQAKTKGRRKGKRMKAGRENPRQRNRKCNMCGKRGQKHDKRNCPYKNKSGSEAPHIGPLHDALLENSSEDDFDDEDSEQSQDE